MNIIPRIEHITAHRIYNDMESHSVFRRSARR